MGLNAPLLLEAFSDSLSEEMNILQIMPQVPYPLVDGGKVGLYNITKHLAERGHSMEVLCFGSKGQETPQLNNVRYSVIHHSTKNTPFRVVQSVFTHSSLYLKKHYSVQMLAAIEHVIQRTRIDILYADHTCMAPFAAWASQRFTVPWVLRLHNVEWMIWQRYAERFSVVHPIRWYMQAQANKVRWEEADMIRMADTVFAITDVDAQRARTLGPSTNIVLAPAGVDAQASPPVKNAVRTELVIASNWGWIHNVDGLRWFLDKVMPLIRSEHDLAHITLGVLGRNPPAWITRYIDAGVVAEGFVDDLHQRLQQSLVFLSPLFVGSGIRIKILEAMSAGLPVVSTSVGAEGIALGECDGLIRADDPVLMKEAISFLLRNTNERDKLSINAHKAVLARYTWQSSAGVMESAMLNLVRKI